MTVNKSCFFVDAQQVMRIGSFEDALGQVTSLEALDQVDTTQFDATWTSPYWPTLKAKYDLVMPGEPPSGGANVPDGGADVPAGGAPSGGSEAP